MVDIFKIILYYLDMERHRNPPQVRKRQRDTVRESSPDKGTTPEQTLSLEQTAIKLSEIFEIDRVTSGEAPRTVLGGTLKSISTMSEHVGAKMSAENYMAILPDLTAEVRKAVDLLRVDGVDIANDHKSIPIRKGIRLMEKYFREYSPLGNMDLLTDQAQGADLDELEFNEDISSTFCARLLRTFMTTKGTATNMQMQEGAIDSELLSKYTFTDQSLVNKLLAINPSSVRRETSRDLRFIMSDSVTNMLRYYGIEPELPNIDPSGEYMHQPPLTQLDFTILPAGELEEVTRIATERLSEAEKARVDLKRISVLESIRNQWGEDRCFFAHGRHTGKQMLDEETGSAIDEDYIVLVMQQLSDNGDLLGEHALAISPIAKKHAAYLTRYDVSAGNWREVLSLSKPDARYVGARDLRFTSSSGWTAYDMMVNKVNALLGCSVDDFHGQLRMDMSGNYRVKNYNRDLGRVATR